MSNNISIVIPFSQNTGATTLTFDTSPGLTGHIMPWNFIGSTTDTWLYSYERDAKEWSLNLLDESIENKVGTSNSLKYLAKPNENYNLQNFYCEQIVVTIHKELNDYYSLENLYVTTNVIGSTSVVKYIYNDFDGNNYYFNLGTNISVGNSTISIEDSFSFTLKYRLNADENQTKISLKNDPRASELFKVTLHGKSILTNELNISPTGVIDFREYSRTLLIRDTDEHGYLEYDKINEKYRFLDGSTTYTRYEFNIIESSLYKINIKSSNGNTTVLVPELKIKSGKLAVTIPSTTSEIESVAIDFCELILHDSEVSKVPMKSNILRLTKS